MSCDTYLFETQPSVIGAHFGRMRTADGCVELIINVIAVLFCVSIGFDLGKNCMRVASIRCRFST